MKPKFDPTKPFTASKPAFDPSKPVDAPPSASVSPPPLGAMTTGAINYGNWAGFNVTSPAAAALMAMGDVRADKTGTANFGDAYRRNLGFIDQSLQAGEEAHPLAKWLGRGLGVATSVGVGALTGPVMAAARGAPAAAAAAPATLGTLMKEGAKFGMPAGALAGAGASREGTPWGVLKDAGIGGTLGGLFGAVAPPLVSSLGWVARNVAGPAVRYLRGGYVTPTPEAERLGQMGIKLTLGQMNPASPFGRIEELAANKVTGGSLAAARQASNSQTRDALLKLAGAPSAAPPVAGAPVAQQLDELATGFANAYDDALAGAKLWPEKYLGKGKWKGLLSGPNTTQGKGAFEVAAAAKDIDASPAVRERALAWLTDKAESLAPRQSGPDAGRVDAKSIQALRTQLRDKIRGLGQEGEDRQLREIFGRAEEFVTELLEGQLPADKTSALRATDAAYRNLLAVRDAAKRAFVQNEEFTPAQLLQAIRSRGASPELESAARDAQAVLSAKYPLTGIQVAANESIPLLNKVGPGWAAFANASPWWQRHALTEMFPAGLPSRALTAAGRAIEAGGRESRATVPTFRTLYDLLRPRPDSQELQWAP